MGASARNCPLMGNYVFVGRSQSINNGSHICFPR